MRVRRQSCLLAFVAAWLGGAAGQLPGCQICVPIPTMSVADRLLEAEAVVLAREDPDKPFSMEVVEVLKGEPPGLKIDLFVDSQSRRQLAADPELGVVCIRRSGGEEPGWRRLGLTTGGFGPLVREVIARAGEWREQPRARLDFFAPLLGHPEPQVRTLAHLEVGRAPYDRIRELGTVLPASEIRAFLDNYRYIEWHALYILLLAQSADPRDHRRIEEAVRSCARFGTATQLAAWVTADIEVRQEAALDLVEQQYLGDIPRGLDELEAVRLALSVQGSRGDARLRDRIVGAYRVMVERHPQLAAVVAGDLFAWERWDLAEPLAGVLASPPPELDAAALAQLRGYLVRAGERRGGGQPARGEPPGPVGGIRLWIALAVLFVLAPALAVAGRVRRSGAAADGRPG